MSLFSGSSSDNGLPTSWPALGKGLSSQSYNDLGTSKAITQQLLSFCFWRSQSLLSIPIYSVHQCNICLSWQTSNTLCTHVSRSPVQIGLRGPDSDTDGSGSTRRALCDAGFSLCGPQASSIGVTWEPVRNQILTPTASEPLGWGPPISVLSRPSGGVEASDS